MLTNDWDKNRIDFLHPFIHLSKCLMDSSLEANEEEQFPDGAREHLFRRLSSERRRKVWTQASRAGAARDRMECELYPPSYQTTNVTLLANKHSLGEAPVGLCVKANQSKRKGTHFHKSSTETSGLGSSLDYASNENLNQQRDHLSIRSFTRFRRSTETPILEANLDEEICELSRKSDDGRPFHNSSSLRPLLLGQPNQQEKQLSLALVTNPYLLKEDEELCQFYDQQGISTRGLESKRDKKIVTIRTNEAPKHLKPGRDEIEISLDKGERKESAQLPQMDSKEEEDEDEASVSLLKPSKYDDVKSSTNLTTVDLLRLAEYWDHAVFSRTRICSGFLTSLTIIIALYCISSRSWLQSSEAAVDFQ
ncbi:hypothetical protein Ciccas_012436, partial [Cichlidogyrus casuarinus]